MPDCAEHAFFREFLGMLPYDSSVVVPNCSEADAVVDTKKSNRKIISTGTNLNNFKFVDVNPVFKYMFRSCKDTHGFTVRGRNYKTDGKKVRESVFNMWIRSVFISACVLFVSVDQSRLLHNRVGSAGAVRGGHEQGRREVRPHRIAGQGQEARRGADEVSASLGPQSL